ncbi:uroporphyrinogen decarboxylase/cobalamine-independent methonine synthase family protein [Nocardioides campestrisoli]|uniref:methionine synthase n=1 Tax=Nocardioides campestrisoli TaxID=2736757 RepID=UPI0015E72286|nr:methionine synthase [Nocardioides campestrisoli]
MTRATGVGSMPALVSADPARTYAEAVRTVLGELPELPHVPELPGRGAGAEMTGRTLAVVAGLGADLQPAGWRLTDAAGVDHRRARSLLAQDLDQVEEQTQGYVGPFKTQVTGPWTLAATVEKPRGDKVLSDHGARRDLAQALAEGVRDHVADLRRRLPGVDRLVVQVDEPALAAVLAARVPTASGFGRHRVVHPPEASAALEWVLSAIADSGAEPWVHSCAAGTPLGLLRGAGARGLAVDLAQLSAEDHDELGQALEAGETVALGVLPTTEPADPGDDARLAERVLRWLDMLGFDPEEVGDRLVVSPACGLAGSSADWARRALTLTRATAQALTHG